jgi:uncharacterized protein (DUF1501 family)
MKRREFLSLAAATTASYLVPHCRAWAYGGGSQNGDSKKLVVVILRGGIDGLNVVVPHGDPDYYKLRPTIGIPRASLYDLDGHFGMHPALSALQPFWQNKTLAFIHASGSPDPTRSHFDAQDYLESGAPGSKVISTGWLNRLLAQLPARESPVRAISFGPTLPRICSGPATVATVAPESKNRELAVDKPAIEAAFDQLYIHRNDDMSKAYSEGLAAHKEVSRAFDVAEKQDKDALREQLIANKGAPLPRTYTYFGKQIAGLIRTDPSVQVAFVDFGGWDTHVNQGAAQGQLANHLTPLAAGLADLVKGLGTLYNDTQIVVMSEFGRTAHENGNGGTDHGHGNVIWLLGGDTPGGKVYARWSGLNTAGLYESRDLAATTDFRSVLCASLADHMRLSSTALATVFPDFQYTVNPFART